MGKIKNIEGQRFGRLRVLFYVGQNKSKQAMWVAVCDCGGTVICDTHSLIRGNTKSCGCITEAFMKYKKPAITHGSCDHPVYNTWCNIRSRCYNKSNPKYPRYGGRGIKVCDEWQDFATFKDWALSHGYEQGLSIDRIDNDRDYCPENCRFVNNKIQSNNRSNNHYVEYNGKTQTISQWAEEYGLQYFQLQSRLKYGWSFEKALTTPIDKIRSERRKRV